MDNSLKFSAIRIAFQEMSRKGYFNVCVVKQAANLLGVGMTEDQKNFYGLLHCVRFADMPREDRKYLQESLEELFSSESFTVTVGKTMLGKPKTQLIRLGEK